MDDRHEFHLLMKRIEIHSDGAIREFIERYGTHILRVVRRNLNSKLRSKYDSIDFVQAVWASFFAIPLQKYDFDRPERLTAFLANLARNKVVEAVRQRLNTMRYNVKLERSLDGPDGPGSENVVGREPTPSAIAIAREEWERMLKKYPSHYRDILLSMCDGQTPQEIATDLGRSKTAIQRVIRRARPRKIHESK